MISVKSEANTGLVLDGIKVIHGVERYRPRDKSPKIGKGEHFLTFHPDLKQNWILTDPKGDILRSYNTSDLRVSLVWRSVCFKSEQEMESWDPKMPPKIDGKEILQTLENDLRKKGVIQENEARPEPVDFAIMLIDNYVKYPFDSKAWFPLNYCTLPEILKTYPVIYNWSKTILSPLCR